MRASLLAVALTTATLAIAAAPAAAQPACGDTITQNTTLTADLNCRDVPGNALIVGADNITLDLNGHTVNDTADAVLVVGHHGVVVRNGAVSSTSTALHLIDVTGSTVRNLDVPGNVNGITLTRSDGNRILNSRLPGVLLELFDGSDHNVVRENLLYQREGVIIVNASSYNRIVHNTVWSNNDTALSLTQTHHNAVRRNALITNDGFALSLDRADDNAIADNTLAEYTDHRFIPAALSESSRNVWRRNEFLGGPMGVLLRSGADNSFIANRLSGAPAPAFNPTLELDGFHVDAGVTGTVLRRNTIRDFGDDGIDVRAPGTLIRRNAANDNGDLGIYAVTGSVDGGGNAASGNGNPLQCTGVVCGT